ncbi:MAG: hypothetical protein Q9161_001526 [Pseudevernia consocians]
MPYPPVPPSLGIKFTPTIHSDTYPAISSISQSNLTGKSVFISGASQGIGHATALSYARAGAAKIAVTARSRLETIEQEILAAAATASPTKRNPPPQVLVLSLDVLDHASVKAAAQTTEHAFGGKLDILINNAGYSEQGIPIVDSDADDYWRTWEINFRGVYWMTKAFLPLLLRADNETGLKTIVNVSSMGALALRSGGSWYPTSKFALLKFTEGRNDQVGGEYAEGDSSLFVIPDSFLFRFLRLVDFVLRVTPELGADTMVFLTQEKRDWLAGRYVSCAWDMPELLAKRDEIVKGDKLKLRLVV